MGSDPKDRPKEEDGERHTLGLLLQLRELCEKAADTQDDLAWRLHELLRSISSSNTPDVAAELTFRVEGFIGRSSMPMRTMSLNGNITVARAAYEATLKLYPNDRWILTWGGVVVADSMPPTPGSHYRFDYPPAT